MSTKNDKAADDLALSESRELAKNVGLDEHHIKLEEFKNKYLNVVFDLNIPAELAKAKTARNEISKARSALEISKKAKTKNITNVYNSLNDELIKLRDAIWDPIKKHEEKIAAAKQVIEDKITKLKSFVTDFDLSEPPTESEFYLNRINEIQDIVIDTSYGDRANEAVTIKNAVIEKLTKWYKRAYQDEIDKDELARLREEAAKTPKPVEVQNDNIVLESKESIQNNIDKSTTTPEGENVAGKDESVIRSPHEPEDSISHAEPESSTTINKPVPETTSNNQVIDSLIPVVMEYFGCGETVALDFVTAVGNGEIQGLKLTC